MKAVDTSTPDVYSRNDPKSPINQAILDLIKEKRRLRRLYNNTKDPNTKSTINKLQKEIRTKINQESTISWEKFPKQAFSIFLVEFCDKRSELVIIKV